MKPGIVKNGNSAYDVLIVGGLGHVGLPLGIVLADAGFRVALFDLDQAKGKLVASGKMPFLEYGAEPILRRVIGKNLHVSYDIADVGRSESVIVCIGTPIDEYLNPRTEVMSRLVEQLAPHLHKGQSLMLRSTVCPGTAQLLERLLRRKKLGVHLSFCPERIVQGRAVEELGKLPQIVSGFSEQAILAAEKLFDRLKVRTIRLSVVEAELAKLFSNAWRYIQFGITNQFYMMAKQAGADYERIHKAMTDGYQRGQGIPKPGFAAGPCLLKDTMQLAAAFNHDFQLGHSAMRANEGLPHFIVQSIKAELKKDLDGVRVGILGMAFKAEIDDIRDSLSYKLAKILRFQGASVTCSDEYVQDAKFVSAAELVRDCEILVIGVPHAAYRELKIPASKKVVDLWGVVPGAKTPPLLTPALLRE